MDYYDLIARDRCDRCSRHMSAKMMSYFAEELICMDCLCEEGRVMAALRARQVDVSGLEGCGFPPAPERYRPRSPARVRQPERRLAIPGGPVAP